MFQLVKTARRVRVTDLAVPADRLATLRAAAERRSGVVLLTGPAGPAKANAAEALAGWIGRDLLRVDLDRVVSRYIGETEKNLERLFARAAASDAVLLFDEADALFGKRSEAQGSADRYAHLEVGYLLQAIERHRGLVVLAVRMRLAIDPAVLRRLRHVIELPVPFPRG